jgi:hypothetical protein
VERKYASSFVGANILRPDVGGALGDNGLHGFTIPIPTALADGVSRNLQLRYEASTLQLAFSPVSIRCGTSGGGPASYAGYVDSVSCATGISGWAADRNRLNQAITVTLWDGATQVASTTANTFRPDVGGVLGDNGLHGFSIPIPEAYKNGARRSLTVRFESSSTPLSSSPVDFTCGTPSGGPAPDYAGWTDSTGCSTITGWAVDRNRLNQPVPVELLEGSTTVASALANLLRPDVGAVVGGSGFHGFSLTTPSSLKDGASHTVQLRYAGSAVTIPNSTQTLRCAAQGGETPPNYVGFVDQVGCSVISGWAADRNRLNRTIDLQIYDGPVLLGTVTAGQTRPDVGAYLGDNGIHGFVFTTPASIKDGKTHTISVRPVGSATSIPGNQTLTCP